MSSILKALEKAEESNSTKRMASDRDLIRSRKSRPSWVMPGAVLCAAALATLATFAVMGGFSRHTPSVPAPAVVARVVPVPAPAPAPVVPTPANTVIETPVVVPDQASPAGSTRATAPPTSAPAALPKTAAKVTAKVAPQANAQVIVPATGKVSSPIKAKTATAPAAKIRAAATKAPVAPVQATTSQARPDAAPAVVVSPAHPEPKVSGIAWQNNGESSFAVVNGRAVLQGSTVDGFKVLEIHQDAVKFSGSNGSFEVPLGGEEK
jgi:general secretion pathway protein B